VETEVETLPQQWCTKPERSKQAMKAIMELTLEPHGEKHSMSEYLAETQKILKKYPLEVELHANGTNVSGDMGATMKAVEECHNRLHGMGAPRIITTMKVETRTDKEQSLKDRVESVNEKAE
jgi:uncharacterized protein (TIGR00106 family)